MTRRKPPHPAELLIADWRSRHPTMAGPASKTELIRLRVEPEFKTRVESEAARRGMSVSAWITRLMTRSLRSS